MGPSSLSGHSLSPDFGLAPGQPSLLPKVVARQAWRSGRAHTHTHTNTKPGSIPYPQIGGPGGKPAAAARTGQGAEGQKAIFRRGRETGSHGEGGGANEVGIPSEFAPGRLWRRLRRSRTAGGPRTTWGTGEGIPSWRLPGACPGQVGWGDRGRGQAPSPRASAPP